MPGRLHRLHLRAAALALGAWTLLAGASGPPCREPASCPMDATAAAPTCDGMSSGCCQPAGERAPHGPAAAAPVALGPALRITADLLAAGPPSALPVLAQHPPPLAALQGIGLHTLLAVFLI